MLDGRDLRRTAVFHAVAHAGGITAAARRLGKSPPAVHADLRRLERDLGVQLMERSGRSLRLTADGRLLFDSVTRALREIQRAQGQLTGTARAKAPLRLGTVTAFGRYRLAPALLERLPPDRPLSLRTGAHEDLLRALREGEIDLAVTYRPVTSAPIECRPGGEEHLVLAGGPGATPVDRTEIERVAFITYDEHDYVFGRWFSGVLGEQPGRLLRHDHFEELEEALASARAGRGVTIAPLDACRAHGLIELGPRCGNEIYLCGIGSSLRSADASLVRTCL